MTVYFDGERIDCDRVEVGVNANLWRGQGWFETVAVEESKPCNLERHLERLFSSLPEQGIQQLERDELVEALSDLTSENDHERARLKLVVWQDGKEFHRAAWVNEYEPLQPMTYREGVDLDVQRRSHPPRWPLTEQKRTSYASALAERERSKGWDVLYCDLEGNVWETGVANIFWLEGDTLRYPPPDGHILVGTVMESTIKKAEELGMDRKAVSDQWDELGDFCWVTNSLIGMLPIRSIGGQTYFDSAYPNRWLELRDALLSDRVFPAWHDDLYT